ncbi:hypothetical protein [Nocardia wallacei]|nr:hypothetical protein [Nocardia wallacei]
MYSGTYTHIAYPGDSLHGYDLCGSISLSAVEATVNLTGLADESTPAEQDCQWRANDGSAMPPGAMVSVMLDDPKIFLGTRSTINGFPARVWDISPASGSGRCVITTTTKRWNPWPGRHRSNAGEFAELLYTQSCSRPSPNLGRRARPRRRSRLRHCPIGFRTDQRW